MDEQITVSPLTKPLKTQTYSRKQFYDEQFGISGDKTDLAVHIVDVLVFTPEGGIILQKRSFDKRHNPGLIDKAVGGHIVFGDTADYTVMVETVQELLTPSFVLRNQADFVKTLKLLNPYLDTIALMESADVKEIALKKVVDGKEFIVNNVVHLYFGVYGGRVRPADKEASGILFYELDTLANEMQKQPDLFSDDLHTILRDYSKEIDSFLSIISKDK